MIVFPFTVDEEPFLFTESSLGLGSSFWPSHTDRGDARAGLKGPILSLDDDSKQRR